MKPFIGKSGRLYIQVVGCSVGRCHAGDSSDVTLAFEDAQGIPTFSREETDILDWTGLDLIGLDWTGPK